MSDMLQLVVEIRNTQLVMVPVTSQIESSQSRRQAEAYRTFRSLLLVSFFLLLYSPAVLADFEQVRELIRRGDFASALRVCEEDLKVEARDFRIWTLKGIALQGLGREAESLNAFRQAIAIQPKFLPALQGAAQLEYQTHDPHCSQTLEAILQLQPNLPTAHAMLGVLAFEQKECPAAIQHFEKAGDAAGDPIIKWQRASCYYQLEQWADAERQFSQLLALNDDPRIRYNLGLAQLDGKKTSSAIETLQPLMEMAVPDSDAMSLLASAYWANRQTSEALKLLRRAIDLYPREERLYVDLATICLEASAFSIGTEVLEVGAQNIPKSSRILTMLGVMQASAGFLEKAQESFKRAEQLAPDADYARIGLAVALMHSGAADQVIRLLREQSRRGSDLPLVNLILAEAILQKGTNPAELAEAESLLLRVTERQPANSAAHSLLAKIYLRRKDTANAVRALETAIRLDPSDRTASYQLLTLYNRLGRTREAAALTESVKKLVDIERTDGAEAGRFRLVRVPDGRPAQ